MVSATSRRQMGAVVSSKRRKLRQSQSITVYKYTRALQQTCENQHLEQSSIVSISDVRALANRCHFARVLLRLLISKYGLIFCLAQLMALFWGHQ